ncbi:MAG: DNA repair protein RecN [Burkholderiales bacterium]
MLAQLSIRDFAIVEAIDLELNAGFTVLTGETGAGKSILIDALALALGDRADAEVVRVGADRAEVSAEFTIDPRGGVARWLAEQALEGDADRLLLRRVIERSGRSRGFINGRTATLSQLREVGEHLVDIHGQHAHQSLTRSEAQRAILDSLGGLEPRSRMTGEAHREWQRLRRVREAFATESATREAERSRLAWVVEELQRLAPQSGEWESLRDEHTRLAHAASLLDGATLVLDSLAESDSAMVGQIGTFAVRLHALKAYDARLAETIDLLEGAQAQLQEAASTLRHYRDRIDLDPSRLQTLEQRIEAIHSAARKLRVRPEELPELLDRSVARLNELDAISDAAAVERDESAALERYREAASALTSERKKAAGKLAREVSAVMKELALGVAKFEVAFEPIEGGSAFGNERVEFAVATNVGSAPKPIAKVASGGELSRIGLAIQVVASKASAVPTMIFDEVDAGIGGAVAEIVGRKLAALGAGRQVLCVTHLPQVAAQAEHQWSVAKIEAKGRTRTEVSALDDKGRVEELARMLGGTEISAVTRRHAAEMLRSRAC